jgi:proline iminopeptidase
MTRIKRILKFVGIAVACLVVAVLSSALLYRKYLQHQTAEARAITSPDGINSLESARIGGIDQWVEVRGQNVNNPIILFIHGGPGTAFIPLAGAWQASWEQNFTVVQWDQRGAGKTYVSNDKELQRRTMNVPQMEQDTLEVVNYLRQRFKRQRIFVLGHSWGSVLGLWLAHEHPDLIYAYVGVGQIINTQQNEVVGYQDALKEGHKRHNDQAVKALEDIAPYPPAELDFGKMQVLRDWERDLLGPPAGTPRFTDTQKILSAVVSAPEYSPLDDYGWIQGTRFSIDILLPEMMTIDLTQLGADFRAPILFFEGRHDPYCPPSLIWEYSQSIKAPYKEFIWFENAGHFPFFEEQQKFADELFQKVLPLAKDLS